MCDHSKANYDTLIWFGSGRTQVVCKDCNALIGSFKGYSSTIPKEFMDAKAEYIRRLGDKEEK